MRWQQRSLKVCALVPSLLAPIALTGCGSPGRTTTIVESWEEQPPSTTTYATTSETIRTVPVESSQTMGPMDRGYTAGIVAQGNTPNSYGAATHRNVTQPPSTTIAMNQPRVTLTSDLGNRTFEGLIANWPQEARAAAMAMQAKYGPPDSSTTEQMIWRDQDPFAEIIVFKNGAPHAFPTQHMDVLAESIYLDADAGDLDELTSFHGNIKVDHARGLMTAKCKDEASNFLALNLAHEVLTGQKSVVEANYMLSEKSRGGMKYDDYAQELMFDVGTVIFNNNVKNSDSSKIEVNYPEDVDTEVDLPD